MSNNDTSLSRAILGNALRNAGAPAGDIELREIGDDPYNGWRVAEPHWRGSDWAPIHPAPDEMPESEWLDRVRTLARQRGWITYHTYDSRRSESGFPDLVMARWGQLVFAELKRQSGKLTGAQREWEASLRLVCGPGTPVRYYVWRPSDWDEVVRVLA